MRPDGGEAGKVKNGVLGIGRFAAVVEREPAAEAGNGFWRERTETPIDDIERVLAQIRHLPAGVVPEPAEVIQTAIGVIRPLGGRAEEHVPVEIGGRGTVSRPSESRHDVAIRLHSHGDDFADVAVLNQLAGSAVVRPGPLLRAHLHHPLLLVGHVDHPPPFTGKERQRLFDIDILPRRAGQHRHQGVPVIWR